LNLSRSEFDETESIVALKTSVIAFYGHSRIAMIGAALSVFDSVPFRSRDAPLCNALMTALINCERRQNAHRL